MSKIFRKKNLQATQIRREVKTEHPVKKEKMPSESKKIIEDLVMFVLENYIIEQNEQKSFKSIIEKVNKDEFLKNDKEFMNIFNDILKLQSGKVKDVEKEKIFDKLFEYHSKNI